MKKGLVDEERTERQREKGKKADKMLINSEKGKRAKHGEKEMKKKQRSKHKGGGCLEEDGGHSDADAPPKDYSESFKDARGVRNDQKRNRGSDGADDGPSVHGRVEDAGSGIARYPGRDDTGADGGEKMLVVLRMPEVTLILLAVLRIMLAPQTQLEVVLRIRGQKVPRFRLVVILHRMVKLKMTLVGFAVMLMKTMILAGFLGTINGGFEKR